jgi:di/tricarboxylate transporter
MFEAVFTLIVVIVMLFLLIQNTFESMIIFLGAIVVLIASGVITVKEALAGFSNEGMLTVAILFVVARAIQKSPLLPKITNQMFGDGCNGKVDLLKIMAPIPLLSAFLNNTPVVALFMPMIRDWALRNNISPSKFLLPLSYLAMFGGLLTLVGTSTNLVVSGMLQEIGDSPLGMFEITTVGLPLAIIGVLYLVFYGYNQLPNNEDLLNETKENYREYLVTFRVEVGCNIIGKSIEKAGLRNLEGLFLIEIIRNKTKIIETLPNETLKAGDQLIFTGRVDTIFQLQEIEGLTLLSSAEDFGALFKNGKAHIVEAVISNAFPFLNKTIKESNFRSYYNASVVAVIRNGERINEKIGKIILRPGDTVLLLANSCFDNQWDGARDFYLMTPRENEKRLSPVKSIIAIGSFLMLIVLSATGILSTIYAALLALAVLLFTRTVSVNEAFKSIHWETIVVIAFSFGIGTALINTGAADMVAQGLIKVAAPMGGFGVLVAVYLVTNIFTAIVTNNAAAVIAFPIAYAASQQLNLDPRPFIIAVVVAASGCFLTPFGYQTNLMIYGPGGYTFKDFIKIGLPLTVIFFIVAMILIPVIFPFG